MFYLLFSTGQERDAMMRHLAGAGITAVFHYLPLHASEMGGRFGGRVGDCPVTEWASERLLRLPFYNTLADAEQAHVVREIKGFYEGRSARATVVSLQ